jgi:hypothetical protein
VEHCRTFSKVSDKKGVSNDDVKYSDQFINLKKFLAGCKDNEEFCILLAHQKWMKYFENSKNVV